LALLFCGLACLLWAFPLAIGGLLLVLLPAGFLQSRRDRERFRELSAARSGESICTFARSFERRKVDTWVIRAVYEELQEYVGRGLPIRSQDRLQEDLRIDDDDLDMDLAVNIAKRTGRSLKAVSANPYFGRVHTVEELVLFFNSQPSFHI